MRLSIVGDLAKESCRIYIVLQVVGGGAVVQERDRAGSEPPHMVCEQPWYTLGAACPYGVGVKGFDVTIPDRMTFGEALCVIYGFSPYLVIAAGVARLAARRTLGNLLFALLPGVVAVLAKVWKALVVEPRPLGTCLQGCGMPSGHSQVAASYVVWLVAEGCAYRGRGATPARRALWGIAWSCLFLPTPPCRIVTGDHSVAQVLAGMAIGAAEGWLWFRMAQAAARNGRPLSSVCRGIEWGKCRPPLLEWWMGAEQPAHDRAGASIVNAAQSCSGAESSQVVPAGPDASVQ